MKHSRLWLSATIIALVVIGGFILSVPHTEKDDGAFLSKSAEANIPLVTLRDSFKKGVHTITGSLEAPNACTSVSAEAVYATDSPETGDILVLLSLLADPGICLQLPTRISFTATVSAPANLPIRVLVDGAAATTTAL
ncbi:MAG: hypothetical protein WC814_01735 [Candidatus Paceibacterota bacterium]|jgi:hypothetical protein